jgi:hypothetical protein
LKARNGSTTLSILTSAVIRVLTITQERRDVAESARDKLYADLWGGLRFSLNERSCKYFFVFCDDAVSVARQ